MTTVTVATVVATSQLLSVAMMETQKARHTDTELPTHLIQFIFDAPSVVTQLPSLPANHQQWNFLVVCK